MSTKKPIEWVLASGSKHRQKQLSQSGIQALAIAPNVDESIVIGEAAQDRAARLATAKAQHVASTHPSSLVIGSDQVASLDGQILRKPGTHSKALSQLMLSSGKTLCFDTAVCVVFQDQALTDIATTRIRFQSFSEETAQRYLELEQPYDAAGSFYSEAMGQWLIAEHHSSDPSAIIGLPMLTLGRILNQIGIHPLDYCNQG